MEDSYVSMGSRDQSEIIHLPPGFRFHPTNEEIITHYLTKKVIDRGFSASAIGEADLNKCEPWDLPKRAKMGEKEWYFFSHKDRKYPTGMRTNRATDSGYWKATGKDKAIYRGKNCLVGMKKTLVFYTGRAPKREKTNWVMHEYRLDGKFPYYNLPKAAKDEWVVCRIFHKSTGSKKPASPTLFQNVPPINSSMEGHDLISGSSLPSLTDPSEPSSSFIDTKNDELQETANNNGSTITLSNPYNSNFPYYYQIPSTPSSRNIMVSNSISPSYPLNHNFSMQVQNPSFSPVKGPLIGPTYSNQLGTTIRLDQPQCKVEPIMSRSIISGRSQETGLSMDPEISSSSPASKQEVESYRPLDDLIDGSLLRPMSSPDILDFSWDYY